MGNVVNKITQGLGLTADPNAGAAAMQQSMEMQRQAMEELKKVAPSDYAKLEELARKASVVMPEFVGELQAEELNTEDLLSVFNSPAFQKMAESEAGIEAELDKIIDQGGMTEEMKSDYRQFQDQATAQAKAEQESITQQAMQQGRSGSGVELAQQIAANQASAQRRSQAAQQMAGAAQNSKMAALQSKSALAGQQGQRGMQEASAKQNIAQFNALQRTGANQANLARRQQLSDIGAAQQRQMYGQLAGIEGQKFGEAMQRAGGVASGMQNYGNALAQQSGMQAQAAQAQAAGNMALLGAGISAFSDKNVKKDIDNPSTKDIREMLDKIEAFTYKYKNSEHGEGKQMGVMAQDLEKSKLGKEFVKDTEQGKVVDYGKMASTMAASLADISKRLDKVEGKKMAEGGIRYNTGIPSQSFMKAQRERDALSLDDMQALRDSGLAPKNPMLNARPNRNERGQEMLNSAIDGIKGMFSSDGKKEFKPSEADYSAEYEASKKAENKGKSPDELRAQLEEAKGGSSAAGVFGNALMSMGQKGMQRDMMPQRQNVNLQQKVQSFNPLQGMMAADGGVRRPEEVMSDIQNLMKQEFAEGGVKYEDGGISPELRQAAQSLRQQPAAPGAPMPGGQPPMPPAPMPQGAAPMPPQGMPMPPQGAPMPPQGVPPMPPQGQMMADGGMAYEDGGEGTIIDSGMEMYEGDQLPDRINDGEMVLNVEQQDRLNDALMELKRLKSKERTDKMLADGKAEINPMQQESIMSFVRGEIDVDELPSERVVKEPSVGEPSGNMAKLLGMVSKKRRG